MSIFTKNTKIKEKDLSELSRELIAKILDLTFPLPFVNEKKYFDPSRDIDFKNILAKYENEPKEKIAYEYLLLSIENMLKNLKTLPGYKKEDVLERLQKI